MSRTTSSLRPRRAAAPAASESAQPYSYLPRPASWSAVRRLVCCSVMSAPSSAVVMVGLARAVDAGMWVVHTPSPLAMVARRCTCVPTRREITWVSASHSCGNSAATCATGQWCWHSCPPEAIVDALAAYPRRSAPRPAPRPGRAGRRPASASRRGSAPPAPRPARRRTRRPPRPAVLGDPAQRRGGQVVVRVRAARRRPASVSAKTLAGRPRPRWPRDGRSRRSTSPSASIASRCRRIAGRAEPERLAQLGGGRGALLQQQLRRPGRGCARRRRRPSGGSVARLATGFHNTNVT